MEEAYSVLCDIRMRNKIFRRACSQVILLNHKIESAKARYDRARAVRRLSFRYSNRLKLTSLEGVRNLIYEYACVKCEEIEALQARLRQLTGGIYDFLESDESESDDQLSDCWMHSAQTCSVCSGLFLEPTHYPKRSFSILLCYTSHKFTKSMATQH